MSVSEVELREAVFSALMYRDPDVAIGRLGVWCDFVQEHGGPQARRGAAIVGHALHGQTGVSFRGGPSGDTAPGCLDIRVIVTTESRLIAGDRKRAYGPRVAYPSLDGEVEERRAVWSICRLPLSPKDVDLWTIAVRLPMWPLLDGGQIDDRWESSDAVTIGSAAESIGRGQVVVTGGAA